MVIGTLTSLSPKEVFDRVIPYHPIFFVMCMDKLAHLISHEVVTGNWEALNVCHNGPNVSHMMLVDGLLLFGHATSALKSTLDKFCDIYV